jgi:hypothetical protein
MFGSMLGVACSGNAVTGVAETCEGDIFVAARWVDCKSSA